MFCISIHILKEIPKVLENYGATCRAADHPCYDNPGYSTAAGLPLGAVRMPTAGVTEGTRTSTCSTQDVLPVREHRAILAEIHSYER